MSQTYKRGSIAGGSQFQQTHHNPERHNISDLTTESHRALYLTDDQHNQLLDLIDQSVTDRLNDDAETQAVSLPLLNSVYGALELIAKGQRTDVSGLLSNLIRDTLSQYVIKNG